MAAGGRSSPGAARWFAGWGTGLGWRHGVPGAEAVLLGRDGRAVVYTLLDARRRDLLVLDAGGRSAGRLTVGGPITAVTLSPDGQVAAAGTAGGAVEIHPLDGRSPSHRTALQGTVQQLYYDTTGGLVVTTAAPAGIAALGPDGAVRWRHAAAPGQEFRIGVPPRGEGKAALTIAAQVPAAGLPVEEGGGRESGEVAAAPEVDPNRIDLVAFSGLGKPVWRQVLRGRDPHLGVMPASGSVVVAYQRADRRRLVLRYDRAIAFITSDGVLRRDIGGMVYNPLLVCASPPWGYRPVARLRKPFLAALRHGTEPLELHRRRPDPPGSRVGGRHGRGRPHQRQHALPAEDQPVKPLLTTTNPSPLPLCFS